MGAWVMAIVRLAMAGNIKETLQGYPSKAGGKIYYLNRSSYCLGCFFIDEFTSLFSQLTAIKEVISLY